MQWMLTSLKRSTKRWPGRFKAKGEVKAVQYLGDDAIEIIAPWGEKQYGEPGCYIACSPTDPNDRYIIGEKEFKETYAL